MLEGAKRTRLMGPWTDGYSIDLVKSMCGSNVRRGSLV